MIDNPTSYDRIMYHLSVISPFSSYVVHLKGFSPYFHFQKTRPFFIFTRKCNVDEKEKPHRFMQHNTNNVTKQQQHQQQKGEW
jgi:hypothetical protein